ncbi:MAG: hypothetical protein EG822_02200 [Deltaproteobacteria bacterium]|nr:hypothetical protein [Deltaproteobacteria bacterium]TLN04325.1 MAG: hypothetical protein FDZ73_04095 [bacterium]
MSRNQGENRHFNLDNFSYVCLTSCRETFQEHGNQFSGSVIVRRAIRHYSEHLERMRRSGKIETEAKETLRAAKGVL